jgi:hypothetical protein
VRFILFGSLFLALACSASSSSGPSRPCVVASDCPSGQTCLDSICVDMGEARDSGASGGTDAGTPPRPRADAGGAPETDAGETDASCGSEAIPFEYRPPNVLLVFDRSCSMRRRLDDPGCASPSTCFGFGPEDDRTRWYVAREAVEGLVDRYASRVFWGLMAFPDPREGCGLPVSAEVPPGPARGDAIDAQLLRTEIQPWGLCGADNIDTITQPRETPTADALTSARGLRELMDPDRESFALVVTDGGVTCGTSNDQLRALTRSLRSAGVTVAVIGFATGSEESTLEAIASEGGLPNPAGGTSYYTAESRADLDRVFDEIASRVVSCELSLASTPPDPSLVFVNVNDVPLAVDPTNGWTYDAGANSVVLHGTSCDRLHSGEITRIGVSFGCPPRACEPAVEVCNGIDEDCDDRVDEDCLL